MLLSLVFTKEKGKSTRIILRCRQYFDGFTTGRFEKANVTAASSDGVVILTKSIVKKDGRKGVITKDKNRQAEVQGNSVSKLIMVKKLPYTKISSWIAKAIMSRRLALMMKLLNRRADVI